MARHDPWDQQGVGHFRDDIILALRSFLLDTGSGDDDTLAFDKATAVYSSNS
jgi:hypothetical protein